jgi:carbamoyl-phosphate synthase large subunit
MELNIFSLYVIEETVMDKIKVMVTGAGGAASLGFCRSLREAGTNYEVIGVDSDKYHLTTAEADYKYLVPRIDDHDYINVLNYLIKKHDIDFLHCQPDVEVAFISENREKLLTETNLPSKKTINICMDKWKTYACWNAYDLTLPKTIFINNEQDLKYAFEEIGPKLWLRNTVGAGGKGSLPVDDFEEAKSWVEFNNGYGQFTAAELLSQRTTTFTSIWNNGDLIVAQSRERLYWEYSAGSPSGVTGLTGTGVTVDDAVLNDIAMRAILAVDDLPQGIFSVDMTYDNDGIPNPTEINIGRFFTTHYFFTCAGLNLPDIFVRTSLGLPVPTLANKINPLSAGLTWTRGMDTKPVLGKLINFDKMEEGLSEIRGDIYGK